jgi:hypothetical protein
LKSQNSNGKIGNEKLKKAKTVSTSKHNVEFKKGFRVSEGAVSCCRHSDEREWHSQPTTIANKQTQHQN